MKQREFPFGSVMRVNKRTQTMVVWYPDHDIAEGDVVAVMPHAEYTELLVRPIRQKTRNVAWLVVALWFGLVYAVFLRLLTSLS